MNCHYSILISVNLCQKKDGRRGNKESFLNREETVAKIGRRWCSKTPLHLRFFIYCRVDD